MAPDGISSSEFGAIASESAVKSFLTDYYCTSESWSVKTSAQRVIDLVVASGIKAVLNFSPGALQVPEDVKLKSVDLTVSLENLSFFLAQADVQNQ